MDFAMEPDSEEMQLFRREAQDWFTEAMKPAAHLKFSANWSTRENEEEYEFRRELARKVGAKGWSFPVYPKEYGGGGLTPGHQMVLEKEIGNYGLTLDHIFYTLARLAVPCIYTWGTEEQKQTFLPPLMKGDVGCWQLLTEPQGGSDVANVKTTAIRDGDSYVVNGQKTMVGSIHFPDYFWALVNTDPGGTRHENLSWIYIPTDIPGISRTPLNLLMGRKNTVYFDNVRVPEFYLIGGENNGWKVGNTHFELEHSGAGTLGEDGLVTHLLEHCLGTESNGAPLVDDPDVRDLLADVLIGSHVYALWGRRNWWHRYAHQPHAYGGTQARYHSRIRRLEVAERLQQILGYHTLVANLDVAESIDFEYAARQGPGTLHGGGTLDTDRLIMARRMGLGRPTAEQAPITTPVKSEG
jgi:alkylation response protein AidB-like acyl-CoA dehydrogenase